eukprot:617499-Pleurochrysis_carterae.AAC.1
MHVVEKLGAQRWSQVASHMHGRVGKQCRERWFNHLCPEVKKGEWTNEEVRTHRLVACSAAPANGRARHDERACPCGEASTSSSSAPQCCLLTRHSSLLLTAWTATLCPKKKRLCPLWIWCV